MAIPKFKICKIDGCERTSLTRGWCKMHYERQRKGSNNLSPMPIHQHSIGIGSLCSLKGCDHIERAVGLCDRHYESNKKIIKRIEVKKKYKNEAKQLKYAILCGVLLLKTKNMSLRTAVEAAALHSGYPHVWVLQNAIKAEFPDDYFVKKRGKRWRNDE